MAKDETSLEDLSDNEMYNILKRLRADNLCKMGTLSSTWKVLIKDPYLSNMHRAWSKLNPLLLIVTQPSAQNHIQSNDYETDTLLLTSVDPADGSVTYQVRVEVFKDDFQVLSSGSGCLFCIRSAGKFMIFNATTKEIWTLPKARNPPLGIATEHGSIRSRRNVNPKPILPFVVAAGFGYIESRHVYVLIKLFLSRSCQILVLSETGEIDTPWRTLVQKYHYAFSPGDKGTMVRNKCYWMNRDLKLAITMQISPSKMSILCLNIESDTFHVIQYPDFATYDDELVDVDMQLGELKDELCFGYGRGNPFVMDIWALKDEQNSDWNMQYRVDLSLIGGMDDRVLSEVKFMGYREGEQGGVLILHDSRQQELLYYSEEGRFEIGVGSLGVSIVFPYSERFNSIRRPAAREGNLAGPSTGLELTSNVTSSGPVKRVDLQKTLSDSSSTDEGGDPDAGFGLGDILKPEFILPLLDTLSLEQGLASYLPEGHWSPEALMETLQSPHFRQQVNSFTYVLRTGKIDLTQFGIEPIKYKFTISSFLEALEDSVLKTSETQLHEGDDKDSVFQTCNKNDSTDEGL